MSINCQSLQVQVRSFELNGIVAVDKPANVMPHRTGFAYWNYNAVAECALKIAQQPVESVNEQRTKFAKQPASDQAKSRLAGKLGKLVGWHFVCTVLFKFRLI